MLLDGKVALITGASSGIGRATAVLFGAEGASLALLGRNQDDLRAVANEIEPKGGTATVVVADVSVEEQSKRAVEKTLERYEKLDVLVNAAGVIGSGDILSTRRADWDQMMRVNLDAVFTLMQLTVPHLQRSEGNIVNVSSVTGLRAFPNVLAYCVSKAGVDQLTRCAALELAVRGVRVNAVNPGVVETNLHRRAGMAEDAYRAFLEHSRGTHPLGRVGQPREVAEAILFLASPQAAWLTGVTLSVDGGRHLTCAR
ncbi:MAG: glucose 1-dehydrogenase [Acidobacteriota bacterium]